MIHHKVSSRLQVFTRLPLLYIPFPPPCSLGFIPLYFLLRRVESDSLEVATVAEK